MERRRYQFVVIGSGFGGAIMSMVLRRLGRSVLMVEQGRHPRFAIGESSTPFSNLLLERIAKDYDLPFLRHLSEWGAWQEYFPEIPAGLKRGFTFFHHQRGKRADFRDRSKQLLVAASPDDRVADTHWYRPQFDLMLVQQAVKLGVEYRELTTISSLMECESGWRMQIKGVDGEEDCDAEFLVDATGSNSTLAERLGIAREGFDEMPRTCGIWAHFEGVKWMDGDEEDTGGAVPPYPREDAAVHHVFEEGWIWVLRFNNGLTSAGAALRDDAVADIDDPSAAWKRILESLPSVSGLFQKARAITPFYASRQLSFRRAQIVGQNWAMLPSAAGFVDPLLSTGFALTLLGITRLAESFAGEKEAMEEYATTTARELQATADLVSALYAKMHSPVEFNLLTLLYFAGLSFTETAWRLNKEHLAPEFLLCNDHCFTRGRAEMCKLARAGGSVSSKAVFALIASYDIAGLRRADRNNWYPVDFSDLFSNAHKLHASREEILKMFTKMRVAVPTEIFTRQMS